MRRSKRLALAWNTMTAVGQTRPRTFGNRLSLAATVPYNSILNQFTYNAADWAPVSFSSAEYRGVPDRRVRCAQRRKAVMESPRHHG